MPIYRYVCQCGVQCDAFRSIEERDKSPAHCGAPMERRIMPTSVRVFKAYTTVAEDKEMGTRMVIRSQAEHSAFLRRNGYEEVGTDRRFAPKSPEEIAEAHERQRREAAAAPVLSEADLIRDGYVVADEVIH